MESVISASVIVIVIRTRKPFYSSRPGKALVASRIIASCMTLLIPFSPVGRALGFSSLPSTYLLAAGIIIACHDGAAEMTRLILSHDIE